VSALVGYYWTGHIDAWFNMNIYHSFAISEFLLEKNTFLRCYNYTPTKYAY